MKDIQNNQEIPIPEGMEERLSALIDRLEAEEKGRRRLNLSWKWIGGGSIAAAACILLLLVFRFNQEPAKKQPVVAEIVEQDTLQPTQQHVNEGMTQEPGKPNKAMKPHKVHKTQTESMLAEAEPMQEEAEPLQEEAEPLQEEAEAEQDYLPKEPDPYLLAAADAKDIRARGELVYQEVVQIMNNP